MAQLQQPQIMDSTILIQRFQFLSSDISGIKDKLESHDEKLMTLISQTALISRNLEKLARGQRKSLNQQHGQKDKKKQKTNKDSETNWSHLMHLPTALQQNITKFTSDFSFKIADLDKLVTEGYLNESESENICGKSNEADRIRHLIKKIKGRGPKSVQKFLDIIKEDELNAHLVETVNETFKRIIDEGKKKPMCGYCIVRKTVDLRDIADHLWEKRLINDEVYGNIIEMDVPATMQYLWSHVMHFINKARDPGEAKQVLEEALKPKYPELVQPLVNHPAQEPSNQGKILNCTCRARRKLVQHHGSQCDSGTGNVPIGLFESQHNSESENLTSLDSADFPPSSITSASITYSRYWEFATDPTPQVTVTEKPASPDTTTPDCDMVKEERDRSRHSSGKFQHEDREQLESGQFASLPFVNGEDLSNGASGPTNTAVSTDTAVFGAPDGPVLRPAFTHSLSNATIVAKSGSSTDEKNRKTSDSNATITPEADTVKVLDLPLHKASDTALLSSSSASPDKEKQRPKFYLKKACPKRSQKYRCRSEDSSSGQDADDSDEEEPAYKRIRHKNHRLRRRLSRQTSAPYGSSVQKRSTKPDSAACAEADDPLLPDTAMTSDQAAEPLPHGAVLTQPRPVLDSTVGVRELISSSKKSSKKRAKRRKKYIEVKMTENALPPVAGSGISRSLSLPQGSSGTGYDHSIPYNPSWAHRPQNWTRSQWDHNQARRFWRISQLQAASTSSLQFYSDSDLRSEDSDAVAVTDDNTV